MICPVWFNARHEIWYLILLLQGKSAILSSEKGSMRNEEEKKPICEDPKWQPEIDMLKYWMIEWHKDGFVLQCNACLGSKSKQFLAVEWETNLSAFDKIEKPSSFQHLIFLMAFFPHFAIWIVWKLDTQLTTIRIARKFAENQKDEPKIRCFIPASYVFSTSFYSSDKRREMAFGPAPLLLPGFPLYFCIFAFFLTRWNFQGYRVIQPLNYIHIELQCSCSHNAYDSLSTFELLVYIIVCYRCMCDI